MDQSFTMKRVKCEAEPSSFKSMIEPVLRDEYTAPVELGKFHVTRGQCLKFFTCPN